MDCKIYTKVTKVTLVFLLLVFFWFTSFGQTYVSKKQSYFGKNSDQVFVTGERSIAIEGNKFSVVLPPNDVTFKGTFKKELVNDKGTSIEIFNIDGGGLIRVMPDRVLLNLYATDFNTAFYFYLDSYVEPTEEEKRIQKERINRESAESIHKFYVKTFNEFTAACIRDETIRVGMLEEAIPFILGKPNNINKTETLHKVSKQYVYKNQYVYTDNGIVTAIQSSK